MQDKTKITKNIGGKNYEILKLCNRRWYQRRGEHGKTPEFLDQSQTRYRGWDWRWKEYGDRSRLRTILLWYLQDRPRKKWKRFREVFPDQGWDERRWSSCNRQKHLEILHQSDKRRLVHRSKTREIAIFLDRYYR